MEQQLIQEKLERLARIDQGNRGRSRKFPNLNMSYFKKRSY